MKDWLDRRLSAVASISVGHSPPQPEYSNLTISFTETPNAEVGLDYIISNFRQCVSSRLVAATLVSCPGYLINGKFTDGILRE